MIRELISQVLDSGLNPTHLEVINESSSHGGYNEEESPETHFKVVVVSEAFQGLSKVKRQQLVYGLIKDLFYKGLHAFTQSTFTPDEWQGSPQVNSSPDCGHKKLH